MHIEVLSAKLGIIKKAVQRGGNEIYFWLFRSPRALVGRVGEMIF